MVKTPNNLEYKNLIPKDSKSTNLVVLEKKNKNLKYSNFKCYNLIIYLVEVSKSHHLFL